MALEEEYRKLKKKQTGSSDWTDADRLRFLEIEKLLNVDQPLNQEVREALHRQGTADMRLETGGELQPPLTPTEKQILVNKHSPDVSPHR